MLHDLRNYHFTSGFNILLQYYFAENRVLLQDLFLLLIDEGLTQFVLHL